VKDVVEKERIVDFDEADEITFEFLKTHGLFDGAKKERHLANNTEALASLVTEGIGYSVLPEEFARPLLENGKLIDICPDKTLRTDIALAWYPRPEMPPYLSALIKAIG
jgi:DNA-binding transcriptional LysR family regulator